ncbi:Hypothetical predicted protein [Podarcis lilfordi]|uniref:Uncharacterized protein n=1 Tax=Podarcis lilfordi TaxID=74358 RepID=A0AA35LA35_9SAUR|nr:Hypothetical predicted protein [Podarcis lilfordi]
MDCERTEEALQCWTFGLRPLALRWGTCVSLRCPGLLANNGRNLQRAERALLSLEEQGWPAPWLLQGCSAGQKGRHFGPGCRPRSEEPDPSPTGLGQDERLQGGCRRRPCPWPAQFLHFLPKRAPSGPRSGTCELSMGGCVVLCAWGGVWLLVNSVGLGGEPVECLGCLLGVWKCESGAQVPCCERGGTHAHRTQIPGLPF